MPPSQLLFISLPAQEIDDAFVGYRREVEEPGLGVPQHDVPVVKFTQCSLHIDRHTCGTLPVGDNTVTVGLGHYTLVLTTSQSIDQDSHAW